MLKQQQQLKQQQKLSPQQIQVIRLLELSLLELEERIKLEIDENPALEEGEDTPIDNFAEDDDQNESEERSLEDPISDMSQYMDEDDDPLYNGTNYGNEDDFKHSEIPYSAGSSLHDSLIDQIQLRDLPEPMRQATEFIIGSLDEDGYFRRGLGPLSDDLFLQTGLDLTAEQLSECLSIVQELEPSGIGATSLQECLLIQLRQRPQTEIIKQTIEILSSSFDEFSKRHFDKIMRRYDLTEDNLKEIMRLITSLNPKPGFLLQNTSDEKFNRIIPDFIVEVQDGELLLSMTNSQVERLHISPEYRALMHDYASNKANQTRENKEALLFVKQKLDSARWFIDAVTQRNNTLLSTMQAIVNQQKNFFLTGDDAQLRPMVLRDIAQITMLDISTISRVVKGKYVQTPFGVYPLRHLFSESMQTDSGEEISSREIKSLLQNKIDKEDKKDPISDDKLCEWLNQQGYKVARRTIAKYREQLGIPVARLRRQI